MPIIPDLPGGGGTLLTDSSADGILEARYPSDRRGVLLRAKYPETILVSDSFESGVTNWTRSVGTGTLTSNSTSPLSGTKDLKLAWTVAGTQAVKRTLTTPERIAGGRQIKIVFTIRTTDPQTIIPTPRSQEDYWSLRIKAYDVNGKMTDQKILPRPGANTTRTNWFCEFWLDSSKIMGSVEIILDNTTTNKQVQIDDFKIVQPPPPKVRFIRYSHDGYVRGGDPAEAVMGTAYAFDDELFVGQIMEWTAQPVWDVEWRSSNPLYYGPQSNVAGFTIEDRDPALPSHLVKSLEDPSKTLLLRSQQTTMSRSRQASFVNKQTTGKPAGGISSAYSFAGDYQLITLSPDEKLDLEDALDDAVIYVSPPARYNRSPFYATVTAYKVDDFARMDGDEKIFTITFQEVDRPDTFGQPSFIPLLSYAWLSTQYATYGASALTALTYDQLSFTAVT